MAEQTQVVESKTAEAISEFIITKTGVMIVGSEFMGDKLTALLCQAIEMNEGSGVGAVVARNDNYPIDSDGPVFAMSFADTHSFAINLEHCWQRALEVAKEGDKYLSLLGILWVNVLSSFGHELDHLDLANGDREMFEGMRKTKEGRDDLEVAAKETGQQLIMRLALKYDTEIPPVAELGWLGLRWMALHTDEATKDLDWVIRAREMAEAGMIYEEPENDIKIYTFREFVKQGYDTKLKEDWEQTTTACNVEIYLEDGTKEVIHAEPVEEPKVEAVEIETEAIENAQDVVAEAAPVEAVEVPAQVMGAATAFVGAGTTLGAEAMAADMAPDELAVPLPAPVAAVQTQVVNAAATAVPPPAHTEPTYPECTLSDEHKAAVMKAVWQTVYHHLFTKCGWSQNPQTGRYFFANAAAILEGVNIQHIIQRYGAENFIMEYDTLNAAGQYAPEMCQGMIRGYTTSKAGLPAYAVYINLGGQRFKRSFLPQNPEKIVNNAYTKSADDAAAGNMVAWVFKDEVADNAPFDQKCAVKIRNNEYEVIIPKVA